MDNTNRKSRPRPDRVPEPAEKCDWVYGPVPSRRFGLSLGINLGETREKICTWGCVYCQCGFGRKLSSVPDARFPTLPEVLNETARRVAAHPGLDSITFAGNSEPTSNPAFPEIVEAVLRQRESHPAKVPRIVNCLTNASDIDRPGVLAALLKLDEAWVKLDCALPEMFLKLNRPERSLGGLAEHLARLKRFGAGRLRIQTLVWECPSVPHLGNWTEANRQALCEAYLDLIPMEVHLATIERNPADRRLTPVPDIQLLDFAEFLRQKKVMVTVFPSRGTKRYDLTQRS